MLALAAAALVEVSAAWSMVLLGSPAISVALISTAATAPIVIFVLPAGALADITDRRRMVVAAQLWSVPICAALALASWAEALTPGLVLALVFALGFAMAMRLPSLTAMVPLTVERSDTTNAMTLFGIGSSLSRLTAPIVAGVAFAIAGPEAAFACAGLISIAVLALVRGLKDPNPPALMPSERFVGALRTTWNFTVHSPEFRSLLIRGHSFFFLAAAAFALMPLVVARSLSGSSATFMAVMACVGLGALGGGFGSSVLRTRVGQSATLRIACVLVAIGGMLLAFSNVLVVSALGAALHGAGWVSGLACLTGLAQWQLPDWIRARGMAVTHMSMIGGVAVGAAFWGGVADWIDLGPAIASASALLLVAAATPRWMRLAAPPPSELQPYRYWPEPFLADPVPARHGPIVLMVEYAVRDDQYLRFLEVMRTSRRLRLRAGAVSWSLFRDASDPLKLTEHVVFESWSNRLQQRERTTEADYIARTLKLETLREGSVARTTNLIGHPLWDDSLRGEVEHDRLDLGKGLD